MPIRKGLFLVSIPLPSLLLKACLALLPSQRCIAVFLGFVTVERFIHLKTLSRLLLLTLLLIGVLNLAFKQEALHTLPVSVKSAREIEVYVVCAVVTGPAEVNPL